MSYFRFYLVAVCLLLTQRSLAACEVGQMTTLLTDIRVYRPIAGGAKERVFVLPGAPVHVVKREQGFLQIYLSHDHQGYPLNALEQIDEARTEILLCQRR
jgi:hypothetical protein